MITANAASIPKKKKSKKDLSHDSLETRAKDDAEAEAAKLAARRKKKREDEAVRKMFVSKRDPFEAPLKWWETEHVKYAINYPPVKLYLDDVMGSHIVRLTDRKYMQAFASSIGKHREKQQSIRMKERMVKPPSIISLLMETSYKTLTEAMRKKNFNKLKLYL
ncbi:uncharacterized protein LOC117228501 isoform X2 [Megalopta genalis]|uniref:uncharacterized protein LOC117228501 isoform X2 n=1 Tax=Megalopta genalis TaxID=115081 RepID=UPI003FD32A40